MKAGVAAWNQNTLCDGGECVRRSRGVRTEGRGKGGVPKSPFFEGAMEGGGGWGGMSLLSELRKRTAVRHNKPE